MGDSLHELNRKELKELCTRNNIRTAGVKHEDLVRLLRNKMFPMAPQTPRSMKARAPKALSPGKDEGDPFKTPGKAAGKVRNLRSATLPREDAAASVRKNQGSSRKPLLSKSNTVSSRRPNLSTKSPGGESDATQENFVRRLCQINGLSPLSRKGQPDTASKTSRRSAGNPNGKTEHLESPRLSEGNENNPADVESSEAGSDASRRISEIATDAGPDTLSDFSDADEFRSVSSEPVSKLSSSSRRNPSRAQETRTVSPSNLSSLASGDWDTSDHLEAPESHSMRRDSEAIFPEFPEGSTFLVGDAEALDLSFLHAGAGDPEVVSVGSDHEATEAHGQDHAVQDLEVIHSPMARDYVNYTRGSEKHVTENAVPSTEVSIGDEVASEQSGSPGDLNVDNHGAADNPEDSTCILPAEEVKEVVGESHELAPGNDGTESKPSGSDVVHSDHVDDGEPELHRELPCVESNSPPFQSTDFGVAQKLFVEPEDDSTPSPSSRQLACDAGGETASSRSSRSGDRERDLSVLETLEDEDGSLHTRSISRLDIAASEQRQGVPETGSKTLAPAIEKLSSDGGDGREQDVTESVDRDGGVASVEEVDAPAKQNDAVTPSLESERADASVPLEGADSLEAQKPDNSTIERRLSQPDLDMSPGVHSDSSITKSSGKVTPEKLDRSNPPDREQESAGIKARDGESASTSTTGPDYIKEEGEKEKVSFPLSIILWCSQSCCTLVFRTRTPRRRS